jgi:multiple sugar transport system substrate-binding protein
MKRVLVILLVVAFTFTIGLTGCGTKTAVPEETAAPAEQNQVAETAAAENAPEAVELSGDISYMTWGEPSEKQIYDTVLNDFMAKNPKVKVNYIYTPDDYNTKLQTMIAGNTAPDVFWLLQADVVPFASSDACAELDPWIEKYPELTADMVEGLIKYGQFNGKTYSIPKDWEPIVMYLNEDLFTAAGVPLPTSDWTMQDYIDIAKKLTITKNNQVVQFGAEVDNYWAFWMVFGGNYGGKWFKDGKSNFSDENVVKGLKVMRQIIDDKSAPSPATVNSMGGASDQLFLTGKIAMYPSGRWAVPAFRTDVPFKWSAVEMPKGTTRINPVISGTLAVSKNCKNMEAAVGLIRYILSKDGQYVTMANGLAMPVYKSYMDDPKMASEPPSIAPFKATASYIESDVQYNAAATGQWSKYKSIITAELDRTLNGEITVEEAAANIDKQANADVFK